MPDTFHSLDLASPDGLEGLALARLISRLGVTAVSPATFLWDERGDLSSAWQIWLGAWFSPVLAPAFVAVHRLAGKMRPAEIADQDHKLDRSLSGALRRRSLAAAGAFLGGKAEMRANREWTRFAGLVDRGESPGHCTVLFALQATLYHLPLAPALAAYAWFELESGLPRTGFRDRPGTGEEVLALFASALPAVRLAMGGDRDESSDGPPRLRAI